MLREVAQKLDDWIDRRNTTAFEQGDPPVPGCSIKVLGQTALLELGTPLTLAATKDVDVVANYEWAVENEFRQLLLAHGRELDPLGHEIWMPRETRYLPLFSGQWVEMVAADAESVLLSKALKAPRKNRALLTEYLATGPSPRFVQLAKRYHLDLEQFL